MSFRVLLSINLIYEDLALDTAGYCVLIGFLTSFAHDILDIFACLNSLMQPGARTLSKK